MDEQKFWDEVDNTLILLIQYDTDMLDIVGILPMTDIPFNTDDQDFVGIVDLSDLSCESYEAGQDWHNDPNTHNYV